MEPQDEPEEGDSNAAEPTGDVRVITRRGPRVAGWANAQPQWELQAQAAQKHRQRQAEQAE